MNLLFSLSYYTPYISGLTLYVKRFAEALVGKKYHSTILTMQFADNLSLNEIINGVRVVRAKPLLKVSKGFLSIDWILKSWREVKKCDVVIINLPQPEGIIPALFSSLLNKRLLVIYHCEVSLPKNFFNIIIEGLMNVCHWLILVLAQSIITYTTDFADHSKFLRHFSHKLQSIYPPIELPKLDKRVQEMIMEKIGKKPDFIIGVAGRLAAEKGIEYLLEAIPMISEKRKKIDSFKIIVAGSLDPVGEENYKKKILDLVKKYQDSIVFLGEIKPEDMGAFYSLLDILVLPSINSTESFGMVQVEAMMMGVPVVATDLPGVRVPILQTGMGIVIPIKNSAAISEAIGEILSNKKRYQKPKKEIRRLFSVDDTILFYRKFIQ